MIGNCRVATPPTRHTRVYDLALAVGATVVLFCVLMPYLGALSYGCESLPTLLVALIFWTAVATLYGYQLPLVILLAGMIVAARKSSLGGRFCALLALMLGVVILVQPPARLGGRLEDLQCWTDPRRLAWSIGIGSLWIGIGFLLGSLGRLPFMARRPLPSWMTRSATVLVLACIAAFTLGLTDSFTYPYPFTPRPSSLIASAVCDVIGSVKDLLRPLNMVAVDSSLAAAVLALTLVGIRQGSIGLAGLRTAFLLLGGAHFAVILVNLTRLSFQGGLSTFLVVDHAVFRVGLPILWSSLWLGLGIAFCLIRREWWERAPTPDPPGRTLRAASI